MKKKKKDEKKQGKELDQSEEDVPQNPQSDVLVSLFTLELIYVVLIYANYKGSQNSWNEGECH